MRKKLILIGAGGHAKSVVDSIDESEIELVGFIDENKEGEHFGYPILAKSFEDIENYGDYYYLISIGDVYFRREWYKRVTAAGLKTLNIIDKTALISKSAKIGTANYIGKYTVINADAQIGNNNIINTKALIEHECRIGNHTHMSTGSTVNGNVVVGDGVFFGSCAITAAQVHLGKYSTIGAGGVVVGDIPEGATAVGVPARVIKIKEIEE